MSSSEYGFPIFISSTVYNLIDLRAELAKYLYDLGYKPILSSSDGFHDNSPELEPWESCLQVLQTTYVMVLIIDGKYGETFEWKNFTSIIGERKISPTHAEYLYAHRTNMRMLVFVRKELLTYYQTYRNIIKQFKDDKNKAKEILNISLPKHISIETLEFIEEVKTTRPIPWIKPFENVTDIKQEIQKKMLNELAELFLFKNRHLETVVRAFSTVLKDLPEEKRKETLENIGATKELINEIETQTQIILDLKNEREILQKDLNEKSQELEKSQKAKKKITTEQQKIIQELQSELKSINTRIKSHEISNANYLISGSNGISYTLGNQTIPKNISGSLNFNSLTTIQPFNPNYSFQLECDNCHKIDLTNFTGINPLITCETCKRKLCNNCFYENTVTFPVLYSRECKKCRENKLKF